ncbi:MAG: hypothetical protein HXY40_02195 [Chloroflexi bacterium]|nr:hypothetical protein [Chloroflexota bacterium]
MKLPRSILVIITLAAVLALLLALDAWPYLRGGFGWRWPYETAPLLRAVPLLGALVIYVSGASMLLRRSQAVWPLLLWALLGAALLPVCVTLVRADDVVFELFARTASGLPTGQHLTAAQLGWDAPEWRDWPGYVARPELAASHIGVAPPGLPLLYAVLNQLLDITPALSQPLYRALLPYQCHNYNLLGYTPGEWASAWLGILMPVWAALAVLPLYGVARRLAGTRMYARGITLWYPLIPSIAMFAGTWSTFYPVLMLCVWWALVAGLQRRAVLPLLLAGALMGTALFLNYTFVPLLGVVGLYTLLYYGLVERRQPNPPPLYWPVLVGVWFGLGMLLPWALYGLWSGDAPWEVVRASLGLHLDLDRPYLPWVFIHYWDWTLFNGFVLLLLCYWGLYLWRRQRAQSAPLVSLSLLTCVIFLAVSGTGRGEAGRVWLPFTPLALLGAAEALGYILQGGEWKRVWLALTGAQALLLLVLAVCLNVMAHDFSAPPAAPVAAENLQPVNAVFSSSAGGSFRLEGWQATAQDDAVTLDLRWWGLQQPTAAYWFSVLLVAADGRVYTTGVWQPGGVLVAADSEQDARGAFPTTCWLPNTVIGNRIVLPLPENAATGDWWLSLAAFGDEGTTDERLRVQLPDGSEDGQIGLGPVAVP